MRGLDASAALCLCSESGFVGFAPGNDGLGEGAGHAHGIACDGDGRIHEYGVGTHLHRRRRMGRGA